VEWSPHGVSCLVGPNGSGKSTLVLVLRFLRAVVEHGPARALAMIWGGSHNLRYRGAPDEEPIEIRVAVDGLAWQLELSASGELLTEILHRQGQEIFAHGPEHILRYRGQSVGMAGYSLALRLLADTRPEDEEIQRIHAFVRGVGGFHDPDLYGLRIQGSQSSDDIALRSRCQNLFTMLKSWRLRRQDHHRYEFVLNGLRAAFPGLCEDIDFDEAGQTIVVRNYRPGEEAPIPIGQEANGLLACMAHLAAVASAEPGTAIAIDEPENALHPLAIREFLRRAEQWATWHDITILLTTHSPVILNHFQGAPDKIFVMEPRDGPMPVALDRHKNPDWLADFALGDLYAQGDFGAPLTKAS
jgi:predicted ATPase